MKKLDILKQLKQIRKEQGLSQAYLAWIAGTSRSTVSRLENGHTNVHFITLMNIAQALDYSIKVEFK